MTTNSGDSVPCLLSRLTSCLAAAGSVADTRSSKQLLRHAFSTLLGFGEEDVPCVACTVRDEYNSTAFAQTRRQLLCEQRIPAAERLTQLTASLSRCNKVLVVPAKGESQLFVLDSTAAKHVIGLTEHAALSSLLLHLQGAVSRRHHKYSDASPLLSPCSVIDASDCFRSSPLQQASSVLSEQQLAQEAVYALQGVTASVARIREGRLATRTAHAASLTSLLARLAVAGQRRMCLDAFVAQFAAAGGQGRQAEPVLQAFAAAAQRVLRQQDLALQQLPGMILERRRAEGTLAADTTCAADVEDSMTVLEVAVHSQSIQVALQMLSAICCELQDADTNLAPLLRSLFLTAFQPYLAHMRAWLYTTAPVNPSFASDVAAPDWLFAPGSVLSQAVPMDPPAFLQPVHTAFVRAGQQLRILHQMAGTTGGCVARMGAIAAAEAAEASIAAASEDSLGVADTAMHLRELGSETGATETQAFPVMFSPSAVHQLAKVQQRADKERMLEVELMLANLAEQRQLRASVADEAALKAAQERQAVREAQRVRKAEASAAVRLQRARLLQEQLAARDALSARRSAERAEALREAQEALAAEAEAEHASATAAVALALEESTTKMAQLAQQAQRMAWRTQRWQLAELRRMALQAIDAAEQAACEGMARAELLHPAAQVPSSPTAVLDICLLRAVREQHCCVSTACLRLFQDELRLPGLLAGLRRYYLMQAGDFAENFVAALCSHAAELRAVHERDIQGMLEDALKASSMEHDPFASTLQGRLAATSPSQPGPSRLLIPEDQLDALNPIQLRCDIPWPQSVIVTPAALAAYQQVFSALLRLRRVGYLLQMMWRDLAAGAARTAGGLPAWIAQRVRQVQLFQHSAAHLGGLMDVIELQQAHLVCLERAAQQCMLGAEHEELRQVVDSTLQGMLAFRSALTAHRLEVNGNLASLADLVRDDVIWERLEAALQHFHAQSRLLYRLLQQRALRGQFQELVVQMGFNSFYAC
ncbi:hypothetical protein WJX72_006616 [[Myrmecia] bisecta]|uniref:Gamma-tubulin complex component n=1 Tax=[Myrmecia] bisecta TaxID=41462 RepID=A0AAW1QR71_9CHLO